MGGRDPQNSFLVSILTVFDPYISVFLPWCHLCFTTEPVKKITCSSQRRLRWGRMGPLPSFKGKGGARIALHTELLSTLLSCQGPFPGIIHPQTPSLTWFNYETKIPSIVVLKKGLKTKIYPCGVAYIYIDMSSEEALHLCLRYAQTSLVALEYMCLCIGKISFGPALNFS